MASRRGAAPRIAALAVLPLENLSHDPEQEYFADGMTDALITDLAKMGSLRITSRTSVMRYKGTKKSISEVGRDLNVDAVVEGTVTRSGSRVRITAQLIQVSTDMHLWAEAYDRDLSEVLDLQSAVATDIARRINVVVTPHDPPRTREPRGVWPVPAGDGISSISTRARDGSGRSSSSTSRSRATRNSRLPIPAWPTPIWSRGPTARSRPRRP